MARKKNALKVCPKCLEPNPLKKSTRINRFIELGPRSAIFAPIFAFFTDEDGTGDPLTICSGRAYVKNWRKITKVKKMGQFPDKNGTKFTFL